MSAAKKSALAKFTKGATAEPLMVAGKRQRGKGDTVALTVRLPKDAWMKLQMFAMSEGISLQSLAVHGFNLALVQKGQPTLEV